MARSDSVWYVGPLTIGTTMREKFTSLLVEGVCVAVETESWFFDGVTLYNKATVIKRSLTLANAVVSYQLTISSLKVNLRSCNELVTGFL